MTQRPELEKAAEVLLAHYEDEASHAAFLRLCAELSGLAFAAGFYRQQLGSPERAGRARQGLEQVTQLALAQLSARQAELEGLRERAAPHSRKLALWLGLLLSLLLLLGYLALGPS